MARRKQLSPPPTENPFAMPEVSRFFGIVIAFHYDEHHPPHFHARYASKTGVISIGSLHMIRGSLPTPVLRLVTECARQHQEELVENWWLARHNLPVKPIQPLQ